MCEHTLPFVHKSIRKIGLWSISVISHCWLKECVCDCMRACLRVCVKHSAAFVIPGLWSNLIQFLYCELNQLIFSEAARVPAFQININMCCAFIMAIFVIKCFVFQLLQHTGSHTTPLGAHFFLFICNL